MGRSDADNAEAHNAELAPSRDSVVAFALEGFDRGYRLGLRHAIEYVERLDTIGPALAERMREAFAAALAKETSP